MKFSRSTTYGLRALANLVLAKADDVSRVKSLRDVAQEEDISLKFLEKLFSQLKKSGIVMSTRGAGGGYYLADKPINFTVLNILKALEEDVVIFQCIKEEGDIRCKNSVHCGAVPVLQNVQKAIVASLEGMTLADLV